MALFALCFLPFSILKAQNTPLFGGQSTAFSDSTRPAILDEPPPPDTVPLRFFFAERPEKLFFERDTMPDENFRQHDPTRKTSAVDWAFLGPIGSAARPQFFEISRKIGWRSGLSAFDLYEKQPEDLKFFKNPKAFSDAFYARGIDKNDAQFRGRFARTFDGGAAVSLDFSQHNGTGQLRHEKTQNRAFLAGLRLPVGERYDATLVFSQNRHRQQENYGAKNPKSLSSGGSVPGGGLEIPVLNEDPVTRLDHAELRLTQRFALLGNNSAAKSGPDSLGRPSFLAPKATKKANFSLVHAASAGRERFLFFDPNASLDSSLYGLFWTDERALRHAFRASRLENSLRLEGLRSRFGGLEVGAKHGFWRLDEEPGRRDFQQLFLTAKGDLNLRNSLKINGLADLGLLTNAGEFALAADATVDFGRLGELRGEFLQQRRQVPFVAQKMTISQVSVWANDFSKINETTLGAALEILPTRTTVSARQHVVGGYIFFDSTGLPNQLSSPLAVTQLVVNQRVTWRFLRLEATAGGQNINQKTALRLPRWWAKSVLFYEGRLFKNNLFMTAGVEARIADRFQPEGWQAATGQFFVQNRDTAATYLALDPFVAVKVKTWRLFIRYDNLSALWADDVFYTVARRPMPRQGIRLGISIRWLDGKNDGSKSSGGASSGGNGRPPTGVGRGF